MIGYILMILCGIILAFAGTNFSKKDWFLVFVFYGLMLTVGNEDGSDGAKKGIIKFVVLLGTWFLTLKIKEYSTKKIAP